YKTLCNTTITKTKIESKKNQSKEWVIPAKGAKWVCSNIGVTPCISLTVFNSKSHFCVQVVIVPRLIYNSDEEVIYQMESGLKRQKREPLTVLTLATLLVTGGVGAGTGIASLVKTEGMKTLQQAVDEDITRLEQSIENLADSVRSLSEVVLQNRRGLDLLLLKEGGLCVALQEECCSFVDHTGMVKDSMAELRKTLEKRKRERDLGKTWYEGWFNASPWLTSLLSAVAGPVILMIICLLGPCILKCLTSFIE
ncbi:ENV2 protein, partial [Eubucco bourcierii]|nr:ENV2 protein [Eubucco bourcierii]